jgi:hypothetical protein
MAQVVAIIVFHQSLQQVIVAQVVLMASLLAVLLAWDLRLAHNKRYSVVPLEISPNP